MKPIVFIVLLVAIGAAAGVWYFGDDESVTDLTVKTDSEVNADEVITNLDTNANGNVQPTTGTGSFASILAMGQALECDYTYTPETGGAVAGTTYVDGATEQVRSDFAMQQAGETYESSMIVRDDKVYTWTTSSFGNFALVSEINKAESETVSDGVDSDLEPVSLDDEVSYECRPWTVDVSVFVLPSDVEFKTMEEMMQDRMGEFMPAGMDFSGSMQTQ